MLRFSFGFLLHYACTLSHCRSFRFCLLVRLLCFHIFWALTHMQNATYIDNRCINMFIVSYVNACEGYNLRALLVKWSIMCFDDPEPTQLLNGYALHLHWEMWHSQKCHNVMKWERGKEKPFECWRERLRRVSERAEKSHSSLHKNCHADKCYIFAS